MEISLIVVKHTAATAQLRNKLNLGGCRRHYYLLVVLWNPGNVLGKDETNRLLSPQGHPWSNFTVASEVLFRWANLLMF